MSKTSSAKKHSSALSLADLDNKFNPNVIVPERIRKALKQLGDAAMTAEDFRTLAGVSTTNLSLFAEQFEEHLIHVRDAHRKTRTLWAGTPTFAAQARERLSV